MKGFIKKDLYLTVGYCRSIFLIVFLFLAVSCAQRDNYFFVFYPSILAGMIPATLLSYDEREHFCAYAAAMPQLSATYVSAKYLIGLLFGFACIILTIAVQSIFGIFTGGDLLFLFITLLALTLLTPAIALPFMFRFGVEKGRIAYYIMIGVSSAAALLLMKRSAMGPISEASVLAVFGVLTVLLFSVSWFLSVTFYKKREF